MMTDDNRRDIVNYRIEKANKTLDDAQKNLNYGMYNVAANRLYYAFYYAASALLISNKIEAHTHSGIQTMMHLHFIKTGKLTVEEGVLMRQLFTLRQESDYEDFIDIKQEDLDDILPSTINLVKKLQELIDI